MTKALILLVLAALLLTACADPNGSSRGRDSVIGLANSCAVCGASVSDDYFAGSAYRALGPGSY
jgi:hypothetical protein